MTAAYKGARKWKAIENFVNDESSWKLEPAKEVADKPSEVDDLDYLDDLDDLDDIEDAKVEKPIEKKKAPAKEKTAPVDAGPVQEMSFADLESSTTMKVVVFHDPSVEESNDVVDLMAELSTVYTQYAWHKCTVTLPENAEPVKAAGFTTFPQVFTQTPVDGIEKYPSVLTKSSFGEFESWRLSDVQSDRVSKYSTAAKMFRLAKVGPVFIKFYEEWCTHCKKLKKHFQKVSNEVQVPFLEIECSASKDDICKEFGVEGYPALKLLSYKNGKFQVADYGGERKWQNIKSFLSDKKSWKFEAFTGASAKSVESTGKSSKDDAKRDSPSQSAKSKASSKSTVSERLDVMEKKIDMILEMLRAGSGHDEL